MNPRPRPRPRPRLLLRRGNSSAGVVLLEAAVVAVGVDTTPVDSAGLETPTVSVTGQMVVDTGTVTVVRTVEPAGQLGTVGAQLVTVWTEVVKTVEVVR